MLFINGEHPLGIRAIGDVQRLVAQREAEGFELDIKDVLKDPEDAEEYRILATPTLVRLDVTPPRRVVGDLSNTERVARTLGFEHYETAGP